MVFPRPEGADQSGASGFSAPRGRRFVRRWWCFRAQRAQIDQVLVMFPRPEGADQSRVGGFPRQEGSDRSGAVGVSAPRGRRSVRCWWCFRAQRAQISQVLVVFPRPEGADHSGVGGFRSGVGDVSTPRGRRSVRRWWFSSPRGRRSVRRWWCFRAQRAQISQALVVFGQVLVMFPRPEGADQSGVGGFPRQEGADRSGADGVSAPRGRRSVRCWWCFRAQRAQITQALVVLGQVLVMFGAQRAQISQVLVVFPRPEGADQSGADDVSAPRGRRSVRCWWCFRAQRAQISQVLVMFPRPEGADRSGAGDVSAPRGRRSVRCWWFFRAQRAPIGQ